MSETPEWSHRDWFCSPPRRRFLRRLALLVGGPVILSIPGPGRRPTPTRAWAWNRIARRVPREYPLAQADLYRPHDLAGRGGSA